MEVTRIFDLLNYYKENFTTKPDLLAGKEAGVWQKYDIDQYIEISTNLAYALLNAGITKGDKIATISNNRPEWNFIDMAVLMAGAVHVPIYPTISESDYRFILSHSGVTLVFVSGKELLGKISHLLPEIPDIKEILTIRKIGVEASLDEWVASGKEHPRPDELETIKRSVKPSDIATLIYTSGTTGNPKGVMLTHSNILSNVMALYPVFPLDETCRSLSYLPVSHVYERTNLYVYLYLGVSVYYAENMGTIADNLKEVKPEMLTTVPRLLEKVFDKMLATGRKLKGIKKALFFWAVNLGLNFELSGKSAFYRFQLALANRLVFKKWREALGGNLRMIVSGGAALQPRLARIFTAAGIDILEGYGLTETSPVIAVNTKTPGGRKFGSVGKLISNVKIRIADDGEILVSGPNVMAGYYRNPELTAGTVSKEGWLHTGDLGHPDEDGFLWITGRKKALFKTAMGKYISPEHIENKLVESPFIDAALVMGENQKFAAALIVPDFNHLKTWCNTHGVHYVTDNEIIKDQSVVKKYMKEVENINSNFGKFEQVARFSLIGHEWTVQSGELTANLKLKRNFISGKYAGEIEKIFR
ncbi:MAG: long-chain fatty acid--CoA ligase [Bacteroidales bacterium]|nr:long-chain fatty acid--CoA ligase [Bacteroidales bacterium]